MKLEEVNTRTKEAVDFLVAALESGHSEVLTAYLGAMAKFHTYSFGNVMLIARQKPDATNVAGLRTWNSLGRFVKRGEKGIFILAPMVGRRSTKDVATDEPSENATREACGLHGGEGCELSVTAPAPLASRHRTATQTLKGTNLRSLDSAWIFSSGLLPVQRSLRPLCQSPQRHQAVFMGTGSRHARASSHSPADDMKLPMLLTT